MLKKPVIGLINHGCPKNLVDSELMLGFLTKAGYDITLNVDKAEIVIINTCSFIHDAETESVRSILEMVNKGKKIIITGCLPQKHKKQLFDAIPETLAMLGTSDISKIVEVIEKLDKTHFINEISTEPKYIYPEGIERQQITMGSSSYIKIAEGCDYNCGYCIIPQLRGSYISRPIENIVQEARYLGSKGVNEIVLIAQDTTNYGKDIYKKPSLAKLLTALNEVEEISWIRVMYTYPGLFNDELIKAYANLDKVVKYIDIPLQHSHTEILKLMNRPDFDYSDMIKKFRDNIKDVAIRTAFIVGYPCETEKHFEHLYNFIEKNKFDKMGVFEYSKEKNTKSYSLKPQVPAKIKKQRKKELMILQQNISSQINQSLIGKKLPTIIENISDDGQIIGRTYRDAPEIDGFVYIDTKKSLLPGDIEFVKITNANEYDLFGDI
ncbi:MAG: 30S ribosomal protein S12 methylthiotransferase RimO [Candidatus Gastranaerophilales bacterium]|nr:30S ribosomal protein S12 methylthiotransferase RimO [Candidatus Gastranaerophilales bacterium]